MSPEAEAALKQIEEEVGPLKSMSPYVDLGESPTVAELAESRLALARALVVAAAKLELAGLKASADEAERALIAAAKEE